MKPWMLGPTKENQRMGEIQRLSRGVYQADLYPDVSSEVVLDCFSRQEKAKDKRKAPKRPPRDRMIEAPDKSRQEAGA